MLKYCSTRWLYIGKVIVRVLEQMDNLTTYFLTKLPTLQCFKGKKGVGSTARYIRIKTMSNTAELLPCMSFIVYTAEIFRPFILLFQREKALIHILHVQMRKLVEDLLHKFVDKKCKVSEISLTALLNFEPEKNLKAQCEMGSKWIHFWQNLTSCKRRIS